MESRKDFEKWEDSIEGINYSLNVFGEVLREDVRHRVLICGTLQRLPKGVRRRVLEEVSFIIVDKDLLGHTFQMTLLPSENRIVLHFILLNFGAMDEEPEEKIESIIAHEIAHHVLGHASLFADPDKEKKADDLCERWGFGRARITLDEVHGDRDDH
jgi:hypothetical protein